VSRAALERQLQELRQVSGQLLPVIEADDRRIRALMDGPGGTREVVIEAPQDPVVLPPPPMEFAAYRATVHRDDAGRILTVDIVPVAVVPLP
jgi:hypothetical protein